MSTPTTATATATLPHYNLHHYPFSHHQSYSQGTSSANYRKALLPPSSNSSRLAYPPSATYSPASGTSHGVAATSSPASSQPQYRDPSHSTLQDHRDLSDMPENATAVTRRRSKHAPDWKEFYKNGLPKEVIVIDDTPEPDGASSALQQLPIENGQVTVNNGQQAPRKRKRADHFDPVYHSCQTVPSSNGYPAVPSPSRHSRELTNSTIQTTTAHSASSLVPANYVADPAPKRKRTTRQQAANEAKRRAGIPSTLPDPLLNYRPPPYPPRKVEDIYIKSIADNSYQENVEVDDEDGHYIVVPDAELTERYQMIKLLGQGTFGKVVQARDRHNSKLVAIKIIRSVQKYRDASKIELRVLATLKANDEKNLNRCIHFRDCFDYRSHICIVMDLLGQSVFDFLKANSFVPFPNSQIQNFARQLFTSVAFLHDLNLIHTDLKPENILLCSNEYQTFTYNRKIPSSSTTVARQAAQRRVLLDTEIRLIDFGSATFEDEYHSAVVSTRHYRAPEIILGLGWSFPCDIWSIGCILVEFFTGDALFQTHDNLEHLAMMEAVVNARIDPHLVSQVNRSTRSGGNPAAAFFKRLKLDYPTPETNRASRKYVKAMKRLDEIIPASNRFLQLFLDLLTKIFIYEPARRITAKEALQHPWFREVAQPDDGTEAARIRYERKRMRAEHT